MLLAACSGPLHCNASCVAPGVLVRLDAYAASHVGTVAVACRSGAPRVCSRWVHLDANDDSLFVFLPEGATDSVVISLQPPGAPATQVTSKRVTVRKGSCCPADPLVVVRADGSV